MSLPALSRVAVVSRRIYGQAPAALSRRRWTLTLGAGARARPPLHKLLSQRNIGDATHAAGPRFGFFFHRNHKLNAVVAMATFSAVGCQIWHMSKNRDKTKEVGTDKTFKALTSTNEVEHINTQTGEGEEDIMIVQFRDWMHEYHIQYPDEETRDKRFSIFKASVELHGYDTYKEYRSALDALSYDDLVRSLHRPELDRRSKVDWVEAGVVSPIVRKQQHCGCCWAMAAIASIEALHYMETKQQIMLSVQELVDCVSENYGCTSGYAGPALEYVKKNGLSSESSYGYTDKSQGLCSKGNKPIVATISGFSTVYTSEEALEEAVAEQPVIILLQCPPSLDTYKGGIIESEYLPPTLPDGTTLRWHYVLIVGYGTDSNGVKYWRFKNSWGETWGEEGYGRIRRHVADKRGVLGIFTYPAMYPV